MNSGSPDPGHSPSPGWLPTSLIAAAGLHLCLRWPSLPSEVPLHFDAHGSANGWGGRQELLILPVIALLIDTLLRVVSLLPDRAPQYLNLPVALTDANREPVLALCRRLLAFLRWMFCGFFAAMIVAMTLAAGRQLHSLPMAAVLAWVVVLLVGCVGYVVSMKRCGGTAP